MVTAEQSEHTDALEAERRVRVAMEFCKFVAPREFSALVGTEAGSQVHRVGKLTIDEARAYEAALECLRKYFAAE